MSEHLRLENADLKTRLKDRVREITRLGSALAKVQDDLEFAKENLTSLSRLAQIKDSRILSLENELRTEKSVSDRRQVEIDDLSAEIERLEAKLSKPARSRRK
jgi:chromosome segregation ATPase